MSILRTPLPEDQEALRWCGPLGHRYAITIDDPQPDGTVRRRPYVETDNLKNWTRHIIPGITNPRIFEQICYKTKRGRKWRRVQ